MSPIAIAAIIMLVLLFLNVPVFASVLGACVTYFVLNPSAGLDGIEAIYSTYKMGDELSIRRIASERNLLISGGSDYHGKNKPHIQLGTGMGHLFVPYELLDKMKDSMPITNTQKETYDE